MKKEFKSYFYSLFSIFVNHEKIIQSALLSLFRALINAKKEALRVLFKLFSHSQNVKILPSACPFEHVKGIEMTYT